VRSSLTLRTRSGHVGSHDEPVAAVTSALEREPPRFYKRNLAQYALRPVTGRHLSARWYPDIRPDNLVIEVEILESRPDASRAQTAPVHARPCVDGAVARRRSRGCH
jgi:hypothetical protein